MIAACGTGMGALACILQDLGFQVTGSDHNIYPPMSDFLMEKGIRLFKGFSPSNISNIEHTPDLVVIGNAVTRENVEAVAVMENNIPYCSMPQALNHFVALNKKILLITGTHGKTTTASILAHVLNEAGLDPSFMIGGIVKGFQSNYRLGKGDYMVIEGDEYDTAFFDKGPKFMHYSPFAAVITSVEFDHADIFRDIDHIKDAFRQFIAKIPGESLIVASGEDVNLREIIGSAVCDVEYYGKTSDEYDLSGAVESSGMIPYDWSCSNMKIEHGHTVFSVKKPSGDITKVETPLMGRHNVMNMLAVYGVAKRVGISDDIILKALKSFAGVRRRQDIRGVKRGITVMDDFAHHPSAVRETISGVKPFFSKGRLIAVFEPRTNSSMRDIFQNDYPKAFDGADIVCIRKPSMLSKVPEQHRLCAEKLVSDIVQRGIRGLYFDNTDEIIEFVTQESKSGDLLLIMSNGGFDNIHQRILERL
ncbi:MAG: UDP-N-acetylmuramate--L-alanine ligase [Desulfamplus sp.]|nr:UDP-N-acetylmuramate--L-alanine ligase [Desulfamplus sp.]